MKVLIISDGHGAVEQLDRLESIARESDMILFGGDFALDGDPSTGKPFMERLAALHDNVFSVCGNCDEPVFRDDLEEMDISVEASISYFNGLMLSGSGGGSIFTRTTVNERTDEELVSDLHLIRDSAGDDFAGSWDNLVLIVHNPPADTACDRITSGAHVGSPSIRAFIERYQPLLVVCGHIHESAAVDRIGKTVVVNPGALQDGAYALVEISGDSKKGFTLSEPALFRL